MGARKGPKRGDVHYSGRRGKCIGIVAVARRMLEDGFTMLIKDPAFCYDPISDDAG